MLFWNPSEFGFLLGMSHPFTLHDPATNLFLLPNSVFRFVLSSLCVGQVSLCSVTEFLSALWITWQHKWKYKKWDIRPLFCSQDFYSPGCLSGLLMYVCVFVLSHLVVIPWTVACQVPLSMGFSRQEHWCRLPFPSLGDLSHPWIEPGSPALQADCLPTELWGKPLYMNTWQRWFSNILGSSLLNE